MPTGVADSGRNPNSARSNHQKYLREKLSLQLDLQQTPDGKRFGTGNVRSRKKQGCKDVCTKSQHLSHFNVEI